MGYNDGLGLTDWLAAIGTAVHPAIGAAYQMVDNAQTGQALKQIDKANDYQTLQQILQNAPVSTAANYDSLHKAALTRKGLLDAAGAQPVADILSRMGAEGNSYDPNFTGQEWVQGMMTTPALGGVLDDKQYTALRASQGLNGNQLIPQALQGAELNAQKMGNLYRAADDVNADKFNPGTITEFLSPTGLGALTSGDKGTGGASLADKLIALKKQSEEGRGATNLQAFLNAVGQGNLGDSPALNALYSGAPRGVKPADIDAIAKTTNITPTVSYHDIGGPGNTVQLAGFDTRGKKVGEYGVPTDKRPKTTVNNYVKAYEDELGKMTAKDVEGTRQSAKSARKEINQLNALEGMLGDIDTGKFTGTGVSLAQVGTSLGIDIDPKLGAKEAAQAITNQMALSMRNPAGGEGMPGAMSDKDREFLQKSVPSLTQSKDGRKKLIQYRKALANRTLQESNMQESYIKKHGRIDDNYYRQLNIWAQKNPIFGR